VSSQTEIIIQAGQIERQYWKDLWRYRELFYFLAWRDILVRYKQTEIGILWALIRHRDFRYVVPFLVQFGLYVSPVGFSSQLVPDRWRLLYSLNPMVGVIDGFRWAILGNESQIYWPGFLLSNTLVLVLLVSGIWFFRRMERTFADVI